MNAPLPMSHEQLGEVWRRMDMPDRRCVIQHGLKCRQSLVIGYGIHEAIKANIQDVAPGIQVIAMPAEVMAESELARATFLIESRALCLHFTDGDKAVAILNADTILGEFSRRTPPQLTRALWNRIPE